MRPPGREQRQILDAARRYDQPGKKPPAGSGGPANGVQGKKRKWVAAGLLGSAISSCKADETFDL